ncbi:hypothetical protein RIVM261_043550 [Rivularia sp. IAM M-261]|nr:hypothetical protein CAL7716_083890 [Calothrix sp. PCC 7716]GJD19399.1 hypothetical protein RIVM261_043550 [Rivularia sp. IAM M-261]
MTNAQPENINVRLEQMDERLELLGDEIDLIRTIQNANRRETRFNSQTIGRLERSLAELADIARLHQQALKANQQNIDRIWLYLESQIRTNGNGNAG